MTPKASKVPRRVGDNVAHARKTLAVAVAMGRAKCLRVLLHEEIDRHRAIGLPELGDEDWRQFRVNGTTRLASLFAAYFAALDAGVGGWVRGRLADTRVDALLDSPHKQTLSGFRNALLHPRRLVDERMRHLHANRKALLAWADELADTRAGSQGMVCSAECEK
jgi:hypothetical protein